MLKILCDVSEDADESYANGIWDFSGELAEKIRVAIEEPERLSEVGVNLYPNQTKSEEYPAELVQDVIYSTMRGITEIVGPEEEYDGIVTQNKDYMNMSKDELITLIENRAIEIERLSEALEFMTSCGKFGQLDGMDGTCQDCYAECRSRFEKCSDVCNRLREKKK